MDRTSGDVVITGKVEPVGTDRFGDPCPSCDFTVTFKPDDNGCRSAEICIGEYYVGYNYTVVNPNGRELEQKTMGMCADADGDDSNDVPWGQYCDPDTCIEGDHQGN